MQREAADESTVRALARKQELELRNLIDRMDSPYEHSFRAAVRLVAAEVEDLHRIRISSAFVGDCELGANLKAMVEAAREAMVNVARHSGADELTMLCEAGSQQVTIAIRDRGRGFDVELVRSDGGLARSITERMNRHGGTAAIASNPGEGTEVELTMPVGTAMSGD
jgi:signal transduction histidine kinase